jgi:tetratricopeptide (TPR) repeat protein
MIIGCKGEYRYPQSLLTADSLSNVNPDSAIRVLQALGQEMVGAPEPDQKYYQLLTIKAKDKAYQPTVSTDSIETLLRYYEDGGDKKLLSTAYYYAGRVYSDAHDAPTALSYYQKSLDAMQDNDLQLKSVIYSQMGYLFLYQYLFVEAENNFKKCYEYGIEFNDTLSILYGLEDMATTYQWQNEYDKSIECLKQAEKYSVLPSYEFHKLRIYQAYASIYYDLKDYSSVKVYIDMPLHNIDKLNNDSSSVFAILHDMYYAMGKVDSASYYAHMIESCGSVYAKERSYKHMTRIFLKEGDVLKSEAAFANYILYRDSIDKTVKTAELQRVHSLYNYHKKESENERLRVDNLVKNFILGGVVILLIVLSISAFIIYKRHKTRIAEKIQRIKALQAEQYRKSQAYIEENNRKIREMELSLAGNQQELESYKKRLLSLNAIAKADLSEHERAGMEIMNSPIRKQVLEKAESEQILSQVEWHEVENTICKNYQDFRERLFTLHQFSKQEYHVTLLLKLQIEPAQIAILTAHTKAAITQTRTRLYKKCFGIKGTADQWDEFVNSL